MLTYRIEHTTRYEYVALVSTSQHVACLQPRTLPGQRLDAWALAIEPSPARVTAREDYFGNTLHYVTLMTPHDELRVSSQSTVHVSPRTRVDPAATEAWEVVRNSLEYRVGQGFSPAAAAPAVGPASAPAQFAYASPYVAHDSRMAEYAAPDFAPGTPILAATLALMHRIHDDFTFDATATTVTTPVTKVLAERRGVCQDFAHLQISCLRSLGLAARYVSGYLLTDPPPGQPRLLGADASHAWVSVFCPPVGWVDVDPTNDVLADERHVTVAWGRDYGDVSPLRGVILGGGQHALRVGVSVVPVTT
jgi:transglutaminase-like putative cysteine protease